MYVLIIRVKPGIELLPGMARLVRQTIMSDYTSLTWCNLLQLLLL